MIERLAISSRRSAVYIALLSSSFMCAAMVATRIWYTGTRGFAFLLWNLFLAWIPFVAAISLYDRDRRGRRGGWQLAITAVWLLFYPNAPYIVTDLIHLVEHPSKLVWFDLVLIATCAWTGLLLGFVSLSLVQSVVRRRFSGIAGWAFVVATTGLGAFGIYLGRFLRWNSWDVLTEPHRLFDDVWVRLVNPFAHTQTIVVWLILSGFLLVAYLAIAALMHGHFLSQKSDSQVF
jgi:uncharacterized membrane protein